MKNFDRYHTAIILLCVLGLVIRIWGINFGLPNLYHQSEKATMKVAVGFGSGDLNPHYFNHPTLLHYLLFFLFGIYFIGGYLIGIFSSLTEFQNSFFIDPSAFYLIGRAVGAIFGSLTIPAVYYLAKKLYSKKIALVSATFMAVNFLHVHDSHYMRHDVPVTFFMVLAYIFFYEILFTGKKSGYYLAGLFIGLAISTNWNAGLLIVPLFVSHLMSEKRNFRNFRFCLYFLFGGLFLTSPFIFLDPHAFITGFLIEAEKAKGIFPYHTQPPWLFYLDALKTGFGLPLLIVIIAGTFALLLKPSKKIILLLIWPLMYFFIFTQLSNISSSYIIPILPFLSIIVAQFLVILITRLKINSKFKSPILCIVALVLIFIPARDSLYCDYLLTRKDTRTQAREWIESNIEPGTKIAIENYIGLSSWVPYLHETKDQASYLLNEIKKKGISKGRYRQALLNLDWPKVTYNLVEIAQYRHISREYENYYDFNDLLEKKIKYAVISEAFKTTFSDERYNPEPVAFYRDLNFRTKLIKIFSPFKDNVAPFCRNSDSSDSWATPLKQVFKLQFSGPTIYIYELP